MKKSDDSGVRRSEWSYESGAERNTVVCREETSVEGIRKEQ